MAVRPESAGAGLVPPSGELFAVKRRESAASGARWAEPFSPHRHFVEGAVRLGELSGGGDVRARSEANALVQGTIGSGLVSLIDDVALSAGRVRRRNRQVDRRRPGISAVQSTRLAQALGRCVGDLACAPSGLWMPLPLPIITWS